MLAWALAYARRGWYVFPVHNPLFDHPRGYLCTCEEYRHSDKCRQDDANRKTKYYLEPEQHCTQPGKCPRVKWGSKATTDEAQIRAWWRGGWATANIGAAMGPSRMLALDADSYKEHYAGDLSELDQETLTSLTGGGGQHLIYHMPAGTHYGNETGDLPDGIDIRGEGGYIVLPPSLHKSGRRYAWELGYGPGEIEAAEMPAALRARLDGAAQGKRARAAVNLAGVHVAAEAPDLAQWRIAAATADTIRNGHAAGADRSKADARVVTALCYAGATDSEILAVFEHYPIGHAGKYAERGLDYLERTIAHSRAYVAAHPPAAPPELPADLNVPLEALLCRAEAWIMTAECADRLRAAGFKRIEGPRRTLAALVQAARLAGSLRVASGIRALAQLAGVGHSSLADHLQRLADGGLLELAPGEGAHVVRLKFAVSYPDTIAGSVNYCPDTERQTFYVDHLGDDAFLSYPYAYAIKRRAMPTVLADSLGAGALVAWHALLQHGALTRSELSEETGVSLASAGAALRRLERGGYVDVSQESRRSPKVYELRPAALVRLEEMRPEMKSAGVGAMRARRKELAAAGWCDWQMRLLKTGDRREAARLKHRRDAADELALKWAQTLEAVGIDPNRRIAPPRERRAAERGKPTAGTPGQWAAAIDRVQQRKAEDFVNEWGKVPSKTTKIARRRFAKALQGMTEDWPMFYAWLERRGENLIALDKRALVPLYLEWEKLPTEEAVPAPPIHHVPAEQLGMPAAG